MSLFRKAGSPFWWADIRIDGRRFRVSTKQKTEQKARQAETALINQLSSGQAQDGFGIRKKAPLLREFAQEFLAYVAASRKSEKTKSYYRNGWRMLESRDIANVRINAITPADAEVLGIQGSGSTVNNALRTLRRMLSLAEEKGKIQKVPRILLVEENQRKQLIEADVEALILAKASRTLRDAYMLIADCGIRPSDCVALSWEHVDFVQGDIFIVGGKTGRKAERYVPMSRRVREMLVRRARTAQAWVFESRRPGREGQPLRAGTIVGRFSAFKRKVGLPKAVVLYSARHTFATDLTEATGSLVKTQKALGHTSLTTTARYNHTRSADIARIMDERNAQRGHNLGHSSEMVQ